MVRTSSRVVEGIKTVPIIRDKSLGVEGFMAEKRIEFKHKEWIQLEDKIDKPPPSLRLSSIIRLIRKKMWDHLRHLSSKKMWDQLRNLRISWLPSITRSFGSYFEVFG